MSFDGTVTRWLERLKAGDDSAAEKIWERYFAELVRLARGRLEGAARREADEEDVALSALNSFYSGVAGGRFPDLHDRDNLWRLLVVITARKASDQRQRERRQKRGGVLGGAVLAGDEELEAIVSREPSPELLTELAEEYERLLARLEDPVLRKIALWKMEGLTSEEIAAELGCVPRTVERKLQLIRMKWGNGSGDG